MSQKWTKPNGTSTQHPFVTDEASAHFNCSPVCNVIIINFIVMLIVVIDIVDGSGYFSCSHVSNVISVIIIANFIVKLIVLIDIVDGSGHASDLLASCPLCDRATWPRQFLFIAIQCNSMQCLPTQYNGI